MSVQAGHGAWEWFAISSSTGTEASEGGGGRSMDDSRSSQTRGQHTRGMATRNRCVASSSVHLPGLGAASYSTTGRTMPELCSAPLRAHARVHTTFAARTPPGKRMVSCGEPCMCLLIASSRVSLSRCLSVRLPIYLPACIIVPLHRASPPLLGIKSPTLRKHASIHASLVTPSDLTTHELASEGLALWLNRDTNACPQQRDEQREAGKLSSPPP